MPFGKWPSSSGEARVDYPITALFKGPYVPSLNTAGSGEAEMKTNAMLTLCAVLVAMAGILLWRCWIYREPPRKDTLATINKIYDEETDRLARDHQKTMKEMNQIPGHAKR